MLKITGELLRRRLAELVNTLNLALTFGADQPMLYTIASTENILTFVFYVFFSYILFALFCAPIQSKRFTQENAKPAKIYIDLCIKLRQIYIFFAMQYRLRVFFKDVPPTESRRLLIVYGHTQYCQLCQIISDLVNKIPADKRRSEHFSATRNSCKRGCLLN